MFLLIYSQDNCMKLADWMVLVVRGSGGTFPAMRDRGKGASLSGTWGPSS